MSQCWTSALSKNSGSVIWSDNDLDLQRFAKYADAPSSAAHHEESPRGSLLDAVTEFWGPVRQNFQLIQLWCEARLFRSNVPHYARQAAQLAESLFGNDNVPSWQSPQLDDEKASDSSVYEDHASSDIPQYVLDYAPVVHLYSDEVYWPCDIANHLHHITPQLNFTPVEASWQHPRLDDLNELNRWQSGMNVFLTSNDNVEDNPKWLLGKGNIPEPQPPALPSTHQQSRQISTSQASSQAIQAGRSDAPAVLVVVNKGHGVVDAFWFFFYSFNLGNSVVLRFGNHVGDWEHTLIRFHNGQAQGCLPSASISLVRHTPTERWRRLVDGQSSIRRLGLMPCTPLQAHTPISSLGVSCTTRPTKVRYGIRLSIPICTGTTFTTMFCDRQT
ncbi:hypothetical protein HC762_01170 [bacterium]|nr:hypothetical protein [bacterium]